MNTWFENVFLPSIYDGIGAVVDCDGYFNQREKWLTVKQTAICRDNMERHETGSNATITEDYVYHSLYYTCEWRGLKVVLLYSKKNSCGKIVFEISEEEKAENAAKYAEYKKAENQKRIKRMRRNPARHIEAYIMVMHDIKDYEGYLNAPEETEEDRADDMKILSDLYIKRDEYIAGLGELVENLAV